MLLAGLYLLAACGSAVTQPKPAIADDHIVDEADLLSDSEERQLEASLQSLERQTSDQVVVVTMLDLGGKTIEAWGYALANEWGVGQKDLDNGVLLIVAPADRKTRIEVGLGLEGLLTDAIAKSIIDEELLPHFHHGRYAAGLQQGVAEISRVLMSDTTRPQPVHEAAR